MAPTSPLPQRIHARDPHPSPHPRFDTNSALPPREISSESLPHALALPTTACDTSRTSPYGSVFDRCNGCLLLLSSPHPIPNRPRHNSSQPQQAAGYSCVIEIKYSSVLDVNLACSSH